MGNALSAVRSHGKLDLLKKADADNFINVKQKILRSKAEWFYKSYVESYLETNVDRLYKSQAKIWKTKTTDRWLL